MKKCPMCAEQIPLTAMSCEYCGAQFEVTGTGYCQNCHQIREADERGQCKVCSSQLADLHMESKFMDEPLPDAETPTPPLVEPPAPSRQKLWPAVFVAVLIFGTVVGLLRLGGKSPPAVFEPTSTATPTRVPTHTPDSVATVNSQSTEAAATAQFAWVDEFAKPILSEIESHPPNFEDDFSSGRPGRWEWTGGNVTFLDGIMKMSGKEWVGASHSMEAVDFAIQFDVRPLVIGSESGIAVNFRLENDEWYNFGCNFYDSWCGMLAFFGGNEPVELSGGIFGTNEPIELAGGMSNTDPRRERTILVFARGDEFGFYVNGKPFTHTHDDKLKGSRIDLGLYSPDGASEAEFDNIKFWDLNKLNP